MNTIDLSPLYRSSVGFDRLASLIDNSIRGNQGSPGYPPYNIEMMGENRYGVTLAIAGFSEQELDIHVENGVLTVSGKKENGDEDREFLYQGIATRLFERKFNLVDYIEVTGASLDNGLLTVSLIKEIPEAMKPKKIEIKRSGSSAVSHSKVGNAA
ncbi:MAG: molecular chaperone IbpA [Flavobacteriales bacterium]|jgi:molecular chaperone IbpA